MIALVALFALLVQALAPALASAAPMPDGANVICTTMGLQIAPAGDGPPAVDHQCKHCVCPMPVGGPPPRIALVTLAVYASADASLGPARDAPPPQARAPPRPLGQGPPAPNA